MPHAASANFLHGATQTQRIDGFHQPRFGAAASRKVHIGDAIEQHHDRHVREATAAFVESQIHRGGHRAH